MKKIQQTKIGSQKLKLKVKLPITISMLGGSLSATGVAPNKVIEEFKKLHLYTKELITAQLYLSIDINKNLQLDYSLINVNRQLKILVKEYAIITNKMLYEL